MKLLAAKPTQVNTETRAVEQPSAIHKWMRSNATWILLLNIVLIAFFGLVSPRNVFFSLESVASLLLNGTEALLLALALTLLLGAGLFDLSLGANLVVSSVAGGLVIQQISGMRSVGDTPENTVSAILSGLVVCIISGALFGLVNGFLIAYLDINSLIATLGTLGIGTGVALILTNGSDLTGIPEDLQSGFGLARVLGFFPVPTLVALAAAVLLWLVVRYTRFGVHTLALGSSRPSAERAGIRVKPLILSLLVIGGALAGLAGFINIAHFNSTTIAGHSTDALTAVTAAVIGGTALEGGRVSIVGTVWGTILAVILQQGLITIGVTSYYQLIAVGVVLIIAVAVDRIRYLRIESR